VLIITAGLKPSSNLTGMAEIKDLALKTEQLEEEKKSKSIGFPVNPVDKKDEADAHLVYIYVALSNMNTYNSEHRYLYFLSEVKESITVFMNVKFYKDYLTSLQLMLFLKMYAMGITN
jgi:hypothetical protein